MNETWYDYVLSEFPGEEAFARVTLVEDSDTLLADEAIFAKLNERRHGGLKGLDLSGGGTPSKARRDY